LYWIIQSWSESNMAGTECGEVARTTSSHSSLNLQLHCLHCTGVCRYSVTCNFVQLEQGIPRKCEY